MSIRDYQDVISKYKGDATIDYAVSVLTGKTIAGKKIKLAVQRHLRDLQRVDNDPNFKYIYEPKETEKIINFSTLLVDLDSKKPFEISPYEAFIVGELQGWVDPETGGKRFDRTYISMARGNGKTAILALLCTYNFLFGQPSTNRQLAVASADTAHAEALYGYMKAELEHLLDTSFKTLKNKWGIELGKLQMTIQKQSTTMQKLSAQSAPSDGRGHFSYVVADEYHLFKDRDFINSITSGQMFMSYSQAIFISTAGVNIKAPMYQDYRRYTQYLEEGDTDNFDSILFLVWENDADDEVYGNPDVWQKSNPLFELPDKKRSAIKKMISERDELNAQGKLPDFIVKNLNRWQNAKDNAYLPIDLIEDATIEPISFSLDSRDVYIGFDASQTNDDFALAFVYPYRDSEGNSKIHLYQHSWIPLSKAGTIEAKERRDGINYRSVERKGYATVTRDRFGLVDEDEVFNYMLNFVEDHDLNVKAVLYDQWGSGKFIRRLDEVRDDWLVIPVRQGIKSLNEPTKYLQEQFLRHNITMFDDEAMRGALTNAVTVSDNNGIKIDKNTNSAKIDIVDAIITALYEGMLWDTDFTNSDEKVDTKNPFAGFSEEEVNSYFMNEFSL